MGSSPIESKDDYIIGSLVLLLSTNEQVCLTSAQCPNKQYVSLLAQSTIAITERAHEKSRNRFEGAIFGYLYNGNILGLGPRVECSTHSYPIF